MKRLAFAAVLLVGVSFVAGFVLAQHTETIAPGVCVWTQISFHIPKGKDAEVHAAWDRLVVNLKAAGSPGTPAYNEKPTPGGAKVDIGRKDCYGGFGVPFDKDPATIGAVMIAVRDGVKDIANASGDTVSATVNVSFDPRRLSPP